MEDFIAEVRKREFLWNKKKIPFGSLQKIKTDELWQEVADVCKITKVTAKCKWRSLRDQFLKELKKVPVYTSGETYYIDERERPKWMHFNNLIFLLNTHTPRQQVIDIKPESIIDIRSSDSASSCDDTKSPTEAISPPQSTPQVINPPTTDNIFTTIRKVYTLEEEIDPNLCIAQWEEESDSSVYDEDKSQIGDVVTPLVMIKPQPPDPSFTGSKRVHAQVEDKETDVSHMGGEIYKCPPKRAATEADTKTESKVMLNCNQENENLLFFRSLLPFMNKMDPLQQLRVRMRFQEIMFEELGAKK